ncbi:MAG: hypothetical protein AMXMBFR13_04890 [Phycisphaerae bacterium]
MSAMFRAGETDGRAAVRWLTLLWQINAGFLLATLGAAWQVPGEVLLRPFSLANEMNLAAWWSGALLLLFGLLCHSIALRLKPLHLPASRAMLVLSLLGLGLFCDEVGSIHERAEFLVPLDGDLALAPFALLGAAALGWSLHRLRQARSVCGNTWKLIALAFLLFGSVYLMEFAEHRIHWTLFTEGLRTVVEEGTELAAMSILLFAVLRLRATLDSSRAVDLLPERQTLVLATWLAAGLALPIVLVRARFTPEQLKMPVRGDFGMLVPIFCFTCAALAALRQARLQRENRTGWLSLALVAIILSVDSEAHLRHYLLRSERTWWRTDLDLLWGIPLLMAVIMQFPREYRWRAFLAALAGSALVLGSALSQSEFVWLSVPSLVAIGLVASVLYATRPAPRVGFAGQVLNPEGTD